MQNTQHQNESAQSSSALNPITNRTMPNNASGKLVLAKPRRWKGKFKNLLPKMPLDVLCGIFALLHPKDLLALSRSAKVFRQYLYSKSVTWIWREACRRIGLSVPEGMTEAAYASWLFDNFCNSCLAPRAYYKNMRLCIRYCKKCIPYLFVGDHGVLQQLSNIQQTFFQEEGSVYYGWDEAFLDEWLPNCTAPGRNPFTLYHRLTCDHLSSEIALLPDMDSDGIVSWLNNRCELNRKQLQLVDDNVATFAMLEAANTQDEDTLKKTRKEQIIAKLTERGWADELSRVKESDEFALHDDVNKAKPLTERTWKNMEERLINLLGQLKTERLNNERSGVIKDRYSLIEELRRDFLVEHDRTLVDSGTFPNVEQLITIGPIKSIIQDLPFDALVERESVKEYFIPETLLRLVDEWKETKTNELQRLLDASRQEPGSDCLQTASLYSATNVFQCTGCKDLLSLQGAKLHICRSNIMQDSSGLWLKWPVPPAVHIPLNACQSAARILEQCGQFDTRTTQEEVCRLNPLDEDKLYFECLTCYHGSERLVMDWFEAVRHNYTHSNGGAWIVLQGQDQVGARKYELADHASSEINYSCRLCYGFMALGSMKYHRLTRHAIYHTLGAQDATVEPGLCLERPFMPMAMTNSVIESAANIDLGQFL